MNSAKGHRIIFHSTELENDPVFIYRIFFRHYFLANPLVAAPDVPIKSCPIERPIL